MFKIYKCTGSFKPISLINGLLVKPHSRLYFSKMVHDFSIPHALLTMWICYSSHEKVESMLFLIESGQGVTKARVTLCDLQNCHKRLHHFFLVLLEHPLLEPSCYTVRKPKLGHEIPWSGHTEALRPTAKLRFQLTARVNCQPCGWRCV